MAIELKDITSKWMYISIKELKESGFWTKDFEDNPQTYSDEWITKAINLSSVKINDWTGGYIGYADNIDNLTEEQQIGVKWATAIYTLHWLSKGTEYLLQATTFSQGSQSYNIDVPQDMQFVPDEVQKILINAGLYENIRFANLKEKDKSWFSNGWIYEFDEGSGYASYEWVRNNYIANFNITSSDNSILINFINRVDTMPQKLDLKVNPNLKFKIDNKSVVYNSNNELLVPFDNDSIYEESGVWKSKQGGDIPTDVIKDSDLNKDYIDKQDGKYIVKTSQNLITNYYDATVVDNFLLDKQDKLITGTNIKTINGNSLLGSGDISISGGNDWEEVDTSDFKPNDNQYILPITPNGIYKYKVELGYLKDNKTIYKSSLIFSEKNFDKNYDVVVGNTFQFSGLPIFTISISLRKGYQNAVINLLNQNGIKYEMQKLSIERKLVS